MRYGYEQTASYARVAVGATYGLGKYVVKPTVLEALSSGGTWAATTLGRAVMGNLLHPQVEITGHDHHLTKPLPEEQPPLDAGDIIGMPALHLVDTLPEQVNNFPPAQQYEDLVA